MEDEGYNAEVDKLKPYLNKSTADSTATYASYFTIRDMVFPKAYKPNELPNQLTSRFGITVPIDKTQIVGEPIILSNGIIYRMKKVDVSLTNRLVTTQIEGENNISYSPTTTTIRNKIFYREKNDLSNILFKDIVLYDTKGTTANLTYRANDLYSTKYLVYWRAINVDLPNQEVPVVFKQALNLIRGNKMVRAFPLTSVAIGNYNDVLLGEITLENAGDMDKIVLISDPLTLSGKYSLSLDYLKFVPVIQ